MKHSQFGEDDHIQAVLKEIGDGSKFLVDIGARLKYSNTVHLIQDHGWTGTLVDLSYGHTTELAHLLGKRAKVVCERATIENINDFVAPNTQLLSIDVDGDDFWLWANTQARPALVIVETNPMPGMHACRYHATDLTGDYGMSLDAALALGMMKDYYYIGRTEVNAFFVRYGLFCEYRLPYMERHAGAPNKPVANVMRAPA